MLYDTRNRAKYELISVQIVIQTLCCQRFHIFFYYSTLLVERKLHSISPHERSIELQERVRHTLRNTKEKYSVNKRGKLLPEQKVYVIKCYKTKVKGNNYIKNKNKRGKLFEVAV